LGDQGDECSQYGDLRRDQGSNDANRQWELGYYTSVPTNRDVPNVARGNKLFDFRDYLIPSYVKLFADSRGVWSFIHGSSSPFFAASEGKYIKFCARGKTLSS
jgi:hypothetical protein